LGFIVYWVREVMVNSSNTMLIDNPSRVKLRKKEEKSVWSGEKERLKSLLLMFLYINVNLHKYPLNNSFVQKIGSKGE